MAEQTRHNPFGPKDRQRVDVDQEWECVWWSEVFGVSVDVLRAAVRDVGPLVAYIDRYLLAAKSV